MPGPEGGVGIHLLTVALGIALLVLGGEGVVRGSLALARRLGISPLVAGLVIVGFGTSAPELVVSINAAISRQPEIAVGNVIGSNTGNILLILGVCAVIHPLPVSRTALWRDGATVLVASLLFPVLVWGTGLGRTDGVLLIALLGAYLSWTWWMETHGDEAAAAVHRAEESEVQTLPSTGWAAATSLVGGLVVLVAGSRVTLHGALGLGAALGVPHAVIGLTVVAIGTSLPEFTVSVLATMRRHLDVAVGNILGSNIFNLLGILGVSSLAQPLPVEGRMLAIDQWVMVASALVLVFFLFTDRRLSRTEGAILLGAYVAYVALMFAQSS